MSGKKIINQFFLWLLPIISQFHPKNKGKDYPQLWYCWPKWMCRWGGLGYCTGTGENVKSRKNPLHILRTKVCEFLTGHEISKTEWGYGGGLFVDRNCRWCDKVIKVPKYEEDIPLGLESGAEELGFGDPHV